ncbi:hypothetical protein [Eubacterium sp.]|uniref:hypothetical protein n=1 Tax=Eubacterium sp. TaxID=142586 RepID=UPI002FC9AE3C
MREIDDYPYCTLCEVVDRGNYRTLKAIRDLEEGKFGNTEAKTVFHPNLTDEETGCVGLWKWRWIEEEYPDGNKKQYSKKSSETWIEYRPLFKREEEDANAYYNRFVELIGTLQKDHDYFIEFEKDKEENIHCIYCPSTTLEEKNGKLCIKNYVLDVYSIKEACIINERSETGGGIQFYNENSVVNAKKSGKFEAFILMKIIKEELSIHLKKYLADFRGLTKEQRNIFRRCIDFVPDTSLDDTIVQKTGCTKERVKSVVNEFVTSAALKFENKDQETMFFSRMIKNDTELYREFYTKVKDEWQTQNNERVEEAEKRVKENEKHAEELAKEYDGYKQEIAVLNTQIESAQKRLQELVDAEKNLIPKVWARIDEAKQDFTAFLGDYALTTALSEQKTTVESSVNKEPAEIIKGEPHEAERLEDYEDFLSELMQVLKTMGIQEDATLSLGTYLMLAYINHIPLILAGYGADMIADAFSACLAGQKADRYYTTREPTFDFVADGRITAVFNPFDAVGTFQFFSSQPTYCFYIIPTIEELVMEPRGIYDYALPLYTSPFFDAPISQSDEGYYIIDGFEEMIQSIEEETKRSPISLPPGILSSFGKGCIDRLGKDYSNIYDKEIQNNRDTIITKNLFLLQLIPMLLATDRVELIPDLIDKYKLTSERKTISRWCGGLDDE